MGAREPLLSVQHLVTRFVSDAAPVESTPCVDGVSLDIERGRVLGLIGKSGSGKSLTALSILRLLPPRARLLSGRILFEGHDLLASSDAAMRRIRGRRISMIFQEPATALSPVHRVGWQLGTALAATGQLDGGLLGRTRRTRARAAELLARVELPEPERILDTYPHQLSAGMRRRVLIALALAGKPSLLIADEPTTGLDATIQSQILALLARLTHEDGLSTLLITHDLSAVAQLAHDVAVMYAGQVVETAPVHTLFERPQHPYTRALLDGARRVAALRAPSGTRRAPTETQSHSKPPGAGCRFSDSCPQRLADAPRFPRCGSEAPELGPAGARHQSRCFYPKLDDAEDS
jgi:oligopeptide/dipeptide ABC transporter ATP-binding protein